MGRESMMAMIERGTIKAAEDGAYIVASLDRRGIESTPIKAIDDGTYTVDDVVYFFLFPDGTGRILCAMGGVD